MTTRKCIYWAALCIVVALTLACDRFFRVEAQVVACGSGAPLGGAQAVLVLERGQGEPAQKETTDAEGLVRFSMNEPPTSWATLTISKPGYTSWSSRLQGAPGHRLAVCLTPSVTSDGVR